MQTHIVRLESEIFDTFRCQKAANSLDIDVEKKSVHELKITTDIESDYKIGLIIGASGSGKTTLAKQMFGQDCFKNVLDENKAIIDQFPAEFTYDQCAEILSSIGLTAVPCWIRPVKTLSNGQKARAEAALSMVKNESFTVIDEWTSVVDRTVAKVMSHCIQKFAIKHEKKIVLLSCHYDVVEWINPDWIIDCNKQTFTDRRLLQPNERARTEKLNFQIKPIGRESWKYFSKYHYLTDVLPGGKIYLFGLFDGKNQIGFQCFANYVPTRKNQIATYHSNRTVIHPDYAGFGLGIRLINETAFYMKNKYHYKIMAKFSSIPIFKSMSKNKDWVLRKVVNQVGEANVAGNIIRKTGYRKNVKFFSFEFLGVKENQNV